MKYHHITDYEIYPEVYCGEPETNVFGRLLFVEHKHWKDEEHQGKLWPKCTQSERFGVRLLQRVANESNEDEYELAYATDEPGL